MVGNTFGYLFRVTTWGESHGRAVGCVVDGCPAGLELSERDIQREVDRRRPKSAISTSRREKDEVIILSGIFEGKTLGTPISMLVYNKDVDSKPYEEIKHLFRPGHADYTYQAKFGLRDWRGGGRASGRETVARVMAGAIAKKILERFGMKVVGFAREICGVRCDVNPSDFDLDELSRLIESNPVRCPDGDVAKRMEEEILKARDEGDSVGGIAEVVARGVPAGLGEPVFMKLDAYIAFALMGVPAVKGVEIGAGFRVARMRGSECNDQIVLRDGRIRFETNNAGGILGGISNGEDIVVRVAIKPTPSISKPQKTVNWVDMVEDEIVVKGRHDPCIVPRAIPVLEAMVALVLVDCMMMQGLIPRFLG
ncbi:MAG: chorismate synthase [Archaeoglobales archaeon]|nr:MAG: chorismate synthase [Archaeoglobales archaeon]